MKEFISKLEQRIQLYNKALEALREADHIILEESDVHHAPLTVKQNTSSNVTSSHEAAKKRRSEAMKKAWERRRKQG